MDFYEKLNFDRVRLKLGSIERESDGLIPALDRAVSNLKDNVSGQLNSIKWYDEVGQEIKNEIIQKADTCARKWESDHKRSLEDVVKKIKSAVSSLENIIKSYNES